MIQNIFVNLPTTDLERAKAFYGALGCEIVPEFTDENASCAKWADDIFFMILTREYLGTFTGKPIVDPHTAAQALTAFGLGSRDEVVGMRETILANGGGENMPPQDHGFMYSISMTDPDGNILEFMYMDPAAVAAGPDAAFEAQRDAA